MGDTIWNYVYVTNSFIHVTIILYMIKKLFLGVLYSQYMSQYSKSDLNIQLATYALGIKPRLFQIKTFT